MAKQYDVPLRLVTPHMRGAKVKDAQWLLAGNNRFDGLAPYKDGKLDSEYGPLTAQAARRAKFWLGYPDSALDMVFGQTLYEYLRPNDWRPLPGPFQDRRAKRIAAAADTPGALAFKLAVKEIGYREEPRHGVNDNKFGREYGFNWVPWCAIFESIMFKHAQVPRFRYAAVEAIYWDAVANRNGLYIVRTPRRGDVVGYQIGNDPYAHTAFFDKWVSGATFTDLGGNTGPTDISNGGMVMRQDRRRSMVRFFARIG